MGTDDRHDDLVLPLKIGAVSNGEFLPRRPGPLAHEAIRRTIEHAETAARRHGMSRRRFLGTAAGAATMLSALSACASDRARADRARPGGTFSVPPEATTDIDAAIAALDGHEFIFDVQTHYVNHDLAAPGGDWSAMFPQAGCPEGVAAADRRACFTVDAYFREMFVRSDTSMSILSALPIPGDNGLNADDMAFTIDVATRLGADGRVLMHGGAYPHRGPIDAALAAMSDLRSRYRIAAWKIYTMVPTDAHFYFDDHDPARPRIGQRFIDHVRTIGPPIICTHKGISSIVGSTPELADPSDIGPAAAANPDISFVVYHSGFEPNGGGTGPFDEAADAQGGVDRLIASLRSAGLGPNSNVYAELGGTWWFLMRDPDAAAHVLGKLLRYVGEDRVVWGTDSIWFGTPQDQIRAMRTFEISEEFQERFGYPAITPELRAKIFGLTSARLYGVAPIRATTSLDPAEVDSLRAELPAPTTYGPTTKAEAAEMIAAHQAGYAA